ncbi:thiamine pyrophosphate-binding protein [Actinomadura viridis]|uniref:thiamine pyrophosphate-binding protein n=1 Tax=Actinomadura viridis TaxID=58110 RepID=UPI003691EA84
MEVANVDVRTGAELVVESLHRLGVDTVFGVPGDTGVDLYDAFAGQQAVRHVLARDERHAASMADVYARCTNAVGVVEVSSGGGVTFVVGGLGEPFAASIPLLLITSDIHTGSRNTGALTEIDQERLFGAVTKWRRTVRTAAEIPDVINEGYRAAMTGRPAPAAVIIPEDILAQKVEGVRCEPRGHVHQPDEVDGDATERCAATLAGARRPAIVAGGGVHTAQAWPELAGLVERLGIPVATTIQGKGAYPEASALSLGVVGANGARDYANEYLSDADAVLFVGTRANATDTNGYSSPTRDTTVFHIDIDAERAGRNYPGSTPLVGDAKRLLELIAGAAPAPPAERTPALRDWIAQKRRDWERARDRHDVAAEPGLISSHQVFRTVRDLFDDEEIVVVSDCGTPTPYLGAYWETTTGRKVILARGHGPMGFAVPGAVGAALACPDRQVVCFTTDGSLAMSCGELETAARLNLPIRFIHLSNNSLGWIKMLQHLYFGRRYHGVEGSTADPVPIAAGFGVPATRAHSAEEFRDILSLHRERSGPTFVDVHVPDQTVEVPPVAPWHAALEGSAERPVY